MIEVHETLAFRRWHAQLRDDVARSLIVARIERLRRGSAGDVRPVGGGVMELRVHYGAGYRVYFMRSGRSVLLLLAGGDKRSQNRDIARARQLAQALREEWQT
ncbi:MAG: type II toxin-antitoxin system RelE/ParE family toxin [Acidimicrobiaceae bacterium]|nr:type II toxin-antitoxin system RelE/ParE family toxin [Acidimicrobiaceae bacterium]